MPLARGELRSPIFRIAIDTTMARQANVMLEYTYEEALDLLTNNLKNAVDTVDSLDTDLDFIKDQITTTEVNIARVYNNGEPPFDSLLQFPRLVNGSFLFSCFYRREGEEESEGRGGEMRR